MAQNADLSGSEPALFPLGLMAVFCKRGSLAASKHFVFLMSFQLLMALPLAALQEAGKGPGKMHPPSEAQLPSQGPPSSRLPLAPSASFSSSHRAACELGSPVGRICGSFVSFPWSLVLTSVRLCCWVPGLRHPAAGLSLSHLSPLRSGVVLGEESDCTPTWLSLMLSV